MHDTRSAPHGLFKILGLSSVLTCWACGGSETEVLNRFFDGIAYDDPSMVAAVSLVAFPGEGVSSWRVLEVRPTRSEPFRLSELNEARKVAKKARDAQFSRFSDFRRAHYDDLVMIQFRLDQDPGYSFAGELAELRRSWDGYVEDRRTLEGELRDVEQAMEAERRPARESVLTGDDIDLFDGDVLTMEVVVGVESPANENEVGGETPYLFTLRKYNLSRRHDGHTPPSRWIITDIGELES